MRAIVNGELVSRYGASSYISDIRYLIEFVNIISVTITEHTTSNTEVCPPENRLGIQFSEIYRPSSCYPKHL
jgi:hypothetical protein